MSKVDDRGPNDVPVGAKPHAHLPFLDFLLKERVNPLSKCAGESDLVGFFYLDEKG